MILKSKMYIPLYSAKFRKSYKKLRRSGKLNREEVESAVLILASGTKLDARYNDHALHGEYAGDRECHIRGNVLLIYNLDKENKILLLSNIGSHSELFG